jgi:hypothetical protein
VSVFLRCQDLHDLLIQLDVVPKLVPISEAFNLFIKVRALARRGGRRGIRGAGTTRLREVLQHAEEEGKAGKLREDVMIIVSAPS